MAHKIYLIAAADLKNGIGIKGKLPWDLKDDMKFFQETTIKTDDANKRNMVVMGRTTWESIPEKHRPLIGRKNVVLSRNKKLKYEGADVVNSLKGVIQAADKDERIESIFVIGGAKVYEQFIKIKETTGVYLTRISKQFKCDAFFPKIPPKFKREIIKKGEESGIKYEFQLYKK